MAVSRERQLPLYYQVQEELLGEIDHGVWRPGERIPSENELSAKYGVTRATVRQAINNLVNAGKIVRRQGKGTFVAGEARIKQSMNSFASFSEFVASRGLVPSTKVIGLTEVRNPKIAAALGLAEDAALWEIVRLRSVNGKPATLETSYIGRAFCPDLDRHCLDGSSLYQTLRQKYALFPDRYEGELQPTVLTPQEQRLFSAARRLPALLSMGVVVDAENRPIEYCKILYLSERFDFRFTAKVL